jgi:hypothetical protein
MIKPMIHMNGTSRRSLLEGYVNAKRAGEAFREALAECSPNGRDYYPMHDGALNEALEDQIERLQKVNSVINQLDTLIEHCMDAPGPR